MAEVVALHPPKYHRTGRIRLMEARIGGGDIPWARCDLDTGRGEPVKVVAFRKAAEALAARGHDATVTLRGDCRQRHFRMPDGSPGSYLRLDVTEVMNALDPNPRIADAIAHQIEATAAREAGGQRPSWPWETARG